MELKKKPVYPNLVAELKRRGITNKEYGEYLKISPSGISQRLNGAIEFTIGEMKDTKKMLDMDMDYLFD